MFERQNYFKFSSVILDLPHQASPHSRNYFDHHPIIRFKRFEIKIVGPILSCSFKFLHPYKKSTFFIKTFYSHVCITFISKPFRDGTKSSQIASISIFYVWNLSDLQMLIILIMIIMIIIITIIVMITVMIIRKMMIIFVL